MERAALLVPMCTTRTSGFVGKDACGRLKSTQRMLARWVGCCSGERINMPGMAPGHTIFKWPGFCREPSKDLHRPNLVMPRQRAQATCL